MAVPHAFASGADLDEHSRSSEGLHYALHTLRYWQHTSGPGY
jgi:hypothetical protein